MPYQPRLIKNHLISEHEKRWEAVSVPFDGENDLDPWNLGKWGIVYNSREIGNSHNLQCFLYN